LLLAAPAASAHHVISEYGAAPVGPVTVVEVDAQAARFELDGRDGSWQMAMLAVEVAPLRWLSLSARVGVAHVSFADDPDDGGSGLSDSDVGVKVRLLGAHRFTLAGGAALGVPTGDEDRNIGAGHLELTPFVGSSYQAGDVLLLNVTVTGRFSLGGDAGHGHAGGATHTHGSVIGPHADRELVTRATATLVSAPFLMGAGLEWTQPLTDDDDALLTARAEIGVEIGGSTRLILGGDAPLAGGERYAWRARAAVARRF
jgi:hypothetical protein